MRFGECVYYKNTLIKTASISASRSCVKRPAGVCERHTGRVIPRYVGPATLLRHSLPAHLSQPLNFADLIRVSFTHSERDSIKHSTMIMLVRTAEAVWQGDLLNGEGKVTVLGEHVPYSFSSRVEDGSGTNPEELLAAGHAGCVSMALSNELAKAGYTPNRVHTVAGVHLVKVEGGIAISQIDLTIEADVPGIDESTFQELAEGVRSNCPVSQLFQGRGGLGPSRFRGRDACSGWATLRRRLGLAGKQALTPDVSFSDTDPLVAR